MATLRVVTVKASGGDYSSLNAACVGESANLVTLERELRIDCYPLTDTTNAVIGSFTADVTNFVTIRAVSDHGGSWNTSAYLLTNSGSFAALNVATSYTVLDGLQVETTGVGGTAIDFSNSAITNGTISGCIAKANANSAIGIRVGPGWAATNCLVSAAAGAHSGYSCHATATALNCTVVGSSWIFSAFLATGAGTLLKNCLAQGGTCYAGTFSASSTNNLSSDTTAPGTNSQKSKTLTFRAAGDYHLAATDTSAIGTGAVLYGDATYPFATDIDRGPRGTSWDIGADQYVAPTTWTLNDLAPLPVTETFASPATAFSQRADFSPLSILLEAPATAVTITGTIASGMSAATTTLASREVITGAAASGSTAATTALTAREVITGVSATGAAASTTALASTEVISGSIATAGAPDTTALTGVEVVTGALSTALSPATTTLASSEVLSGSIASGASAATMDGTAREVFAGSMASAAAPATTALASSEVISGSVTSAASPTTGDLTGREVVTGSVASASAPSTTTLASEEVVSGSGATASDTATIDSVGAVVFVGAIDTGSSPATTALASAEVVSGSIGTALAASTNDLAGSSLAPAEEGTVIGAITSGSDASSTELAGTVAAAEIVTPGPAPSVVASIVIDLPRERATVAGEITTGSAPATITLRGTVIVPIADANDTPIGETAPAIVGAVSTGSATAGSALAGALVARGAVRSESPASLAALVGVVWIASADGIATGLAPARARLTGRVTHPSPVFGSTDWSADEEVLILAAAADLLTL